MSSKVDVAELISKAFYSSFCSLFAEEQLGFGWLMGRAIPFPFSSIDKTLLFESDYD
jgi:hypothetical protein